MIDFRPDLNPYNKFNELSPFKFHVREAFPYIEADFDALNEYQLLCLVVKYLNQTIANMNIAEENIGIEEENIQALYNAYSSLQDYVNNYFDNLDVQDEINNKLNDMVEDGTLQEIITQYINSSALWCFDNVDAMKQATNLINGSYAKTLGYYSLNDGGGATYKIRNKKSEDVEDNGTIHFIGNNLVAEMIIQNYVTPTQFGAKGNGVNDDTEYVQKCIDFAGSIHLKVILNKVYLVNNLKLKGYNDNFVYNIEGVVSKNKGVDTQPIKNGFITNSNVFNTDEDLGTEIQLHFNQVNAIVKNKNIEYSSFIEKCNLLRSSISNCNITGFDYIINGSSSVNTIIENNNFKNIHKACFKVYDNSTNGFYDMTVQNNYINAFHSGTDFLGKPSTRTCVLLDNYRTGFGNDGRFINNFVDYFTYFIDKGLSWELNNNVPPTYSTRYAGLVANNVFQNMLNMIGLGISLNGIFTNNLFDNFVNNELYDDLQDTNSGAFSIATYENELNDNGTATETFPYRKFENIIISNNIFDKCNKCVYFDFDYDTYPNVTSSSMLAQRVVIDSNTATTGDSFEKLSSFSPQYTDDIFLNTKCQLWQNICKPDILMNDYKVLHNHKIHAGKGSIGQFSDGIYIAKYNGSRSYGWEKISN